MPCCDSVSHEDACSLLLGYSRIELLGTSGYDYIHMDDLEQVAESHDQCNQPIHFVAKLMMWKSRKWNRLFHLCHGLHD